ncbi:MAG: ATP-binding protein [Armatimonadetes bacterium]|nr:ATP-binding protein [Armatimonadota bacterium]
MRQGEVVFLEIPSSPEYVAIARHAIEGIARRMKFTPSQVEDLKIAFGEACTNAVKYGCPCEDASNVEIKCSVLKDGLSVEIRNSISECEHPQVPAQPDVTREGGFGLYMMRQLVDEVDLTWSSETAIVRMFKRTEAPAA